MLTDIENLTWTIPHKKSTSKMDDNLHPKGEKEWVPLCMRDRLSYLHVIGISLGNLGPHLIPVIVPTLLTPMSKEFGISNLALTFILLYGSMAGFVCAPLVGVLSDSCMFKYGRRKLFIIFGSVFMTIGLLVMTFCKQIGNAMEGDNGNKAKQAMLILSYFFTITAMNIANSPTRTICSDVCPPSQQSLMASLCSVFNALGGVTVNLIGGFKLYQYAKPLNQYQFLLIISSILIAISITVQMLVTKEEPLAHKPPKVRPFYRIFQALKKIFTAENSKPFLRTAIPYLLIQMSLFQYNFYFSDFMGTVIFHGDPSADSDSTEYQNYQDGISWAMMCNLGKFVTHFGYGFVNSFFCNLLGMRWVSVIAYGLLTIGLVMFFFIDNKYVYILITALLGTGYAVAMAIPYAIVSLISHPEELGANLGLVFMCTVIGEILSNFGINRLLSIWWDGQPRIMIGISSVIGLIATVLAFWTIEPPPKRQSEYMSITTDYTEETPSKT